MTSNEVIGNETILTIDDDTIVLSFLKAILEPEGFNVIAATDGFYAMQLLRESKVNLVLLDIMMPEYDGYQVIQSIREQSNVPIIMVTGAREKDMITKSLDLGADDFVTKPFSKEVLIARIRNKLKRAKY